MATRKDIREHPSDQTAWGYYNLGLLIGIEYLKRDARKAAEEWTGKPWKEIEDHVELHRVVVIATQQGNRQE